MKIVNVVSFNCIHNVWCISNKYLVEIAESLEFRHNTSEGQFANLINQPSINLLRLYYVLVLLDGLRGPSLYFVCWSITKRRQIDHSNLFISASNKSYNKWLYQSNILGLLSKNQISSCFHLIMTITNPVIGTYELFFTVFQ